MRTITKIEPAIPQIKRKKRVAAYARVSKETDRLSHSLSAQISHYSELIQNNPEWEYAGVYADSFISGTSTKPRAEFQRMLADCDAGKIHIILTKSISRFARNTVDLLETVRHLKSIGVEVRFEKENINSLSSSGEIMLSILAGFAQEESISLSNNIKWTKRKRFEQGIVDAHFRIYGYRWEGDVLVPIPEEAAIVKRIFQNFLDGKSRLETEREFAAEGITTRTGCRWVDGNIRDILKNSTYTGNLTMQKYFIESPLTRKVKKNQGELPKYVVANSHEAIIDQETFDYVQSEMARRKELGPLANKSLNISCFTSRIKCGNCGCNFQHDVKFSKLGHRQKVWMCATKRKCKHGCPNKTIPDSILYEVCADVLGIKEFDEAVFSERVENITEKNGNELEFHMKDGTVVERTWYSHLRPAPLWTHPIRRKIFCGKCGSPLERTTKYNKDGIATKVWRCVGRKKGCNINPVHEEILKKIYLELSGREEYCEKQMAADIDRITIDSDDQMTFHFVDGRIISHDWKMIGYKRPPLSPKARLKTSKFMKEYWRKRHAEDSHADSRDHQ